MPLRLSLSEVITERQRRVLFADGFRRTTMNAFMDDKGIKQTFSARISIYKNDTALQFTCKVICSTVITLPPFWASGAVVWIPLWKT
jgi:hypothetical protein